MPVCLSKGGKSYEYVSHIPAEEKAAADGAWVPQTHEHRQRKKSPCPPQSQGQTRPVLLKMQVGNAAALRRNWEFHRAYRRGKCVAGPALICYCFKGKGRRTRIGVTAAKKIGSAVERNRARRVIKEAYRSICPLIEGGWDLVFVAREGTGKKKSPEIAAVMQAQLKKAGVLVGVVPTNQ